MRTVNLTLEFKDKEEARSFELWLLQYTPIKKFVILPDTDELYDTDPAFKKMVKQLKKDKQIKNDYINKHNK